MLEYKKTCTHTATLLKHNYMYHRGVVRKLESTLSYWDACVFYDKIELTYTFSDSYTETKALLQTRNVESMKPQTVEKRREFDRTHYIHTLLLVRTNKPRVRKLPCGFSQAVLTPLARSMP
jgi:hypothetical protein